MSERWIWFARIGVAAAALAGLVLAYIFLGISSLAFIGRLLLAIAALAVLIFVHEGGHFVAAKLSNLKVYEFMFGLPGPKLYVKRVGETDYGVTAIPFGGYVKFAGSDPFEELPPEDEKRAFSALPFWKKVLIIAAGPVTNVIFALILFYGVFQVAGIGVPTTTIAFVVPGTPAQAVGLKAKDRIVEAAGKQVRSWTSLVTEIRPRGGQRLALTVVRGNQRLQFSPTLESTRTLIGGRMVQRGFLGVEPGSKLVTPNPLEAARAGWMAASGIAMATFDALAPRQFIKNLPRFSGPIGITRIAVDAAKRGPADYVFFVAVISLSLGIFNLLPLPPLDGGRVLISLIEGIIRRPVPQQVIIGLTAVGASALGVLMVYLVYSDIGKLILGG